MTLQRNLSNSMMAIFASKNKTLTAFSEELGISRSSLQEILRGNSNPRIDTIEQIAGQLDMNPLMLLSSSYSQEDLQLLTPLFQFGNAASDLSKEKKRELATHFHAIINILMESDDDPEDEK